MSALAEMPAARLLRPGLAVGVLQKLVSFPVLLGAFLVLLVFLRVSLVSFMEGDSWWHTTTGEHILRTGDWPTEDFFSYTVRGNHWIAYEWLGEILQAIAYDVGGMRGLLFLAWGLASLLVLLTYYYAALRCGSYKVAFAVCLVLLPPLSLYFRLRPQLLGFAFFVLTLILLEHFFRGNARVLWVLPPLFLIWVNLHGSFVFGFLALGLAWLAGAVPFRIGQTVTKPWTATERRHLLICILACLLVLPLTPYGTRLAAYPLEMSLLQPVNTGTNGEFQPILWASPLWKILLLSILVFVFAQIVRPVALRVDEIALLLLSVYAAITHSRFVLLAVPVLAPLLAVHVFHWFPAKAKAVQDRYVLNFALLLALGAFVATHLQSEENIQQRIAREYPARAVEYLRTHPVREPIFNEYDWGGYLSRSLGPNHQVFIDGRADIYEYGGVLEDYRSIVLVEPRALALLRKYNVQACLIRQKNPLSTLLAASPEWKQVYADEVSAIFVRTKLKPAASSLSLFRPGGEDDLLSASDPNQ